MDPRTAFTIATLFMLLNGGILGLMHRGISSQLQPSASDWRVGTLLVAGGTILLAVQDRMPTWFILPIANAFLLLGVTLYWRAVRRFDGHAESLWIFLPGAVASLGVTWFAVITPNLSARVVCASIGWTTALFCAAASLYRNRSERSEVSRHVLAGILLVIGGFMLVRGAIFAWRMEAVGSILDSASWLNVLTPLSAAAVPVIGTSAFLVLCSERLRAEWERAASTDYLTNLPNRRTIYTTGMARFRAAQRAGTGFATAVIDIDHFKSVNDRFGHDTGDLALQHVARVLAEHCRGPQMVGRLGGEEFVVLLDDANPAKVTIATERLRAAMEQSPLQFMNGEKPQTLNITVSIGLSQIEPNDTEFDAVLRRADKALYVAKTSGRNQVAVYADSVLAP